MERGCCKQLMCEKRYKVVEKILDKDIIARLCKRNIFRIQFKDIANTGTLCVIIHLWRA